jgi:hypothetical protein
MYFFQRNVELMTRFLGLRRAMELLVLTMAFSKLNPLLIIGMFSKKEKLIVLPFHNDIQ